MFGFVLAVAVTPREAMWAFAVDATALAVTVRVARLPVRFVLARLGVVVPFVLFAFLIPFVGGGDHVRVAGLSLSRQGLWGAWNVLAKASLGACAAILLAATTEVPRLLRGLERLRAPQAFTTIAAFMIRYLELIAGELQRMRTAMTARGYDPRWLTQARPIAACAGTLFIRSYERGERVHHAMLSRGYMGTMPDVDARTARPREWTVAGLLPAVAATVAVLAVAGP